MRWIKKLWGLAVATLMIISLQAGPVHAASVYDDLIEQGTMFVSNGGCSGDVSAIYTSLLNDSSKWSDTSNYAAIHYDWQTAQVNGTGWAVTQREAKASHNVGYGNFVAGDTYLLMYISLNSSLSASFTTDSTDGKHLYIPSSVDTVVMAWTGGSSGPASCTLKVVGAVAAGQTGSSNQYLAIENNSVYWLSSLMYMRPVFAKMTINYPSGYDGLVIGNAPPHASYVAMGDSFSSGEGNPPFEAGTNETSDKCHRSPVAYPRLLDSDSSLNLGSMSFVACSGATTSDVLYGGTSDGNWSEGAQVNALSADTQVVTITIGGNDVGFKDFATACTASICNFSTTAYSTIIGKINNDLPDKLADVLDEIASRVSPTTKVYVIGYPHPAPASMSTGASSTCWPLNGQGDDPDPTLNDGATIRSVVTQLNAAIADAVNDEDDARFIYVDPNASGSPFVDHDWCSGNSYFDIVAYNNIEYSFHPTVDGHAAYKSIIEDAMN